VFYCADSIITHLSRESPTHAKYIAMSATDTQKTQFHHKIIYIIINRGKMDGDIFAVRVKQSCGRFNALIFRKIPYPPHIEPQRETD